MAKPFYFSKSRYCEYWQCPKAAWFTRHMPGERARMRESLLAYCKLDTLAMIKVWQRLVEVSAEGEADGERG